MSLFVLIQVLQHREAEVVHANFHSDVGETPFFVAVDRGRGAVVVTIRGTLSMRDILTDLSAESELLPLQTINHAWKGHKVMQTFRILQLGRRGGYVTK